MSQPPVTVLIPTLNESEHIDSCLGSIAQQTYPDQLTEVLLLDGGSTDDTVVRAKEWTGRIPGLRILHNPGRIQAAALNLGLEQASHDIIVRMDAHTTYADDYLERCVAVLEETGAEMVGGPMRPVGETPFQQAVAIATTTPLGVGPGRFHYSEVREPVDTVYLGTFRKTAVADVGGYDEAFAVGEDHELNFRITQAGGTVVLDPTIRSWYSPRSSAKELWLQYFRYGAAKVQTMRKHGQLPTWRPFAPVALVAVTLVSAIVASVVGFEALSIVGAYGLMTLGGAVVIGTRRWRSVWVALVIMHYAYGLGFWLRLLGLRT